VIAQDADRGFLHDDLCHNLVGVVDALAALKAQRERQRVGEVARVGGREPVGDGEANLSGPFELPKQKPH
jgi:hypothetical protein